MKKTIQLLFTLCFLCQSLIAQIVPQFQVTIYVEDAIGNVDSVVVGYDTLATSDIDPEFGEEEILSPFDSILEVRAGSIHWPNSLKTSKVIIEDTSPFPPISTSYGCYGGGTRMYIYIWAKHQPVVVFWDSILFETNVCHNGSMLTNHWADEVTDPYHWGMGHWNEREYCMAGQSSLSISLSPDSFYMPYPVAIEKEVAGMGEQTIYGLRFFHAPASSGYTPCYYFTVAAEEAGLAPEINIFPNPSTHTIYYHLPQGIHMTDLSLIDISGKKYFPEKTAEKVDMSNIPPGMYFLHIRASDGRSYVEKICRR